MRLDAASIGPIAGEILAQGGEVEVLALFERSLYLLARNGLVCVGTEAIGRGPINVVVKAGEKPIAWEQLGAGREAKGRVSDSVLAIGEGLAISLRDAAVWSPPPWPVIDVERATAGLARLAGFARSEGPADGLSALVLTPDTAAARNRFARAAAPQVATLGKSLPTALANGRWDVDALGAATLLLGLGPGLTPSGDDLLGGVMLALTALGRQELRDALWDGLAGELGDLTSEVSAMHLSAAADGLAGEAVHAAAIAVLAGGQNPAERFGPLACLGHTSGWDALAGFALVLRASLPAPAR